MPSEAEKTVSEWNQGDSDYFGGWYRLRRYAMKESSLEADWHGLWNTALSHAVNNTVLPKDQYIELHPQFSVTQTVWSEERLDESISHARPNTRSRRSKELEDGQDPIAARFTSLSLAGPSVHAIDEVSAALTNPASVSSTSQTTIGQTKDEKRSPDWGLIIGYRPGFLQPDECLFSDDLPDVEWLPYLRVLLLVELKRMPLGEDLETKEEYEKRIDNTLECDPKLRKQVYQQVRFTFAQYPEQQSIVHISAIGDYCKIRWFRREAWKHEGLFPETLRNRDLTPEWHELTNSVGVQLLRLVRPGTKTINSAIKSALTRSRGQQLSSMHQQHAERSTP